MARFSKKLFRKLAAYQDMSMDQLQPLLDDGYDLVVWQSSYSPCPTCQALEGATWSLAEFISGLTHNAPMFEHSHVNCSCTLNIQSSMDDTGEKMDVQVQAF